MSTGIIGTGVMGKPMAENILKANYPLSVFARHPEKVQDLIASGATLAHSPAELASRSEVVVLCLPADPEVEDVVLGPEGILTGAQSGCLIVDTTSGTPRSAQRIATEAANKGVGYLEAPVSGGVKGAREGTLTLMVGGNSEALSRARGTLETIGRNIFHVGPVGTGRTLKAVNQVMAGLNAAVMCESLALAERAGISPETFLEVLGKSAADSYQLRSKLPQFIIPGRFDGGFRINLMLKDLDIALEMARHLEAPAFLASLGAQLYRAAAGSGYSEKDTSSMVRFIGDLGGIDV